MTNAKRQHDWNVASAIMALMAEMNRDRKRHRKPYKPNDFNPYADSKPVIAMGTVEQAAGMLGASYRPRTQELPCLKSKPEEPTSS